MIDIQQGMSLTDLMEYAKKDKRYQQLVNGLAMVDQTVLSLTKEIIASKISDSNELDKYFVKTEIMNKCYSLYLFHSVRQVTIGISWILSDFLIICSSNQIEQELISTIDKMLKRLDEKGLSIDNRINWIS